MSDVTIELRCVGCGHKRNLREDEKGGLQEPPTCEKCFAPMIVEQAKTA